MRTLMLVAMLAAATDVSAQTDAEVKTTVLRETNLGDRITVTLRDGAEMRGRFAGATDGLVVEHDGDRRRFAFDDIDRITRSKNGLILGPLIGTAAGFAVGMPVRTYLNNEARDGNRALWVFVGIGAGVGTLLDALMGSERTIYRRGATRTSFAITPQKSGFSVSVRMSMRNGTLASPSMRR